MPEEIMRSQVCFYSPELDSSQWQEMTMLPIFIQVGLTGVGKTTLLNKLKEAYPKLFVFPDRRTLTDDFIIPLIQKEQNLQLDPRNRSNRFHYTRLFKEQYPDGMSYVLSRLAIRKDMAGQMLFFDGLRGENEIAAAVRLLPNAFFLGLFSSSFIRLKRLIGRNDEFDRVEFLSKGVENSQVSNFSELGLPGAESLFSEKERLMLFNLIQSHVFDVREIQEKLAIIVEENKNYDQEKTRLALLKYVPERSVIVDNSTYTHEETFCEIQTFIQNKYF
jgi:hypothetical protein